MAAANAVTLLGAIAQEGSCPPLAVDDVMAVGDRLLANPRYAVHPASRAIVETAIGDLHGYRGEIDQAKARYARSLAAIPTVDTVYHLVQLLWIQGRQQEALQTLAKWRAAPPVAGAYRLRWETELDEVAADLKSGRLDRLIDEARQAVLAPPGNDR